MTNPYSSEEEDLLERLRDAPSADTVRRVADEADGKK